MLKEESPGRYESYLRSRDVSQAESISGSGKCGAVIVSG